jgi:hypothetical protein
MGRLVVGVLLLGCHLVLPALAEEPADEGTPEEDEGAAVTGEEASYVQCITLA